MDAASHRGVEDMRALRDRAIYAPAESRYRVFIIDEAHMITPEGFNALLKIVEEPPAHLIFIFATTEPDKVIQTIRSRTHHYPFRLLTPQAMRQLIRSVVESEGVAVEEAVYPLIIQAGGGSPRDTLSILDQLLAGTGPEGLTYERAIPLLGITDVGLIDSTIDALANNEAGALFTTIDDVIEAGHDPRRFALDLLDRLRDLMVLNAVPNAFELDLVASPAGREEVLRDQASSFTGPRLAQLASTVNEGIGDLRGATSSRLLLEVLFGHLLIDVSPSPAPVAASGHDAAVAAAQAAVSQAPQPEQQDNRWQRRRQQAKEHTAVQPEKREPPQEQSHQRAEPEAQEPTPDMVALLRSKWSAIRKDIMNRNKTAGIMLAQAKVLGVQEDTLVLGHNTGVLAQRLNDPSNNDDIVATVADHAGQQLKVHCVVGTDPVKAGFDAPDKPAPTWNPHHATRRESASPDSGEESERPAPRTPKRPAPTQTATSPARRAGDVDKKPGRWREQIAEVTRNAEQRDERQRHSGAFGDGTPLPPEPGPDEAPEPDEPPPPTRTEQEEEMAEAALEPGENDSRSAMEIAVELLAQELGAKRL